MCVCGGGCADVRVHRRQLSPCFVLVRKETDVDFFYDNRLLGFAPFPVLSHPHCASHLSIHTHTLIHHPTSQTAHTVDRLFTYPTQLVTSKTYHPSTFHLHISLSLSSPRSQALWLCCPASSVISRTDIGRLLYTLHLSCYVLVDGGGQQPCNSRMLS